MQSTSAAMIQPTGAGMPKGKRSNSGTTAVGVTVGAEVVAPGPLGARVVSVLAALGKVLDRPPPPRLSPPRPPPMPPSPAEEMGSGLKEARGVAVTLVTAEPR